MVDGAEEAYRRQYASSTGSSSRAYEFDAGPYHYARSQAAWRSSGGTAQSDEAQWLEFEAKDLSEITLADVPFPQGRSLYVCGADFKKLAKRWHPDK